MSLFSKMRGTIESIFQLGLSGPQLKNNAGVVEARNAADNSFAIVRAASPVADNDVVTKQYADTLAKPFVATAQFDGGNALPANSGTEHFYVVTSTGANATVGQLLWDDGLGTGTVSVLSALEGRTIFTSQAFSGGTVSLRANAFYVWDTVSDAWLLEASANFSGAIREVRYVITNAATQDSATTIPANAYVVEALLEVTTPFSGGATVKIGQAGSLSLVQATTDNLCTVNGMYQVEQDTSWGASELAVRTTVTGAPSAGAGVVIVKYTVPDA